MATPIIKIDPIPRRFGSLGAVLDPKIWEAVWVKELEKEIKEHRQKYWNPFTQTWTHKPTWDRKRGIGRDSVFVQDTSKSTPFVFVEGGTSHKRRAFVQNFRAKTRPGVPSSRPGRRGYTVIFKDFDAGIQARDIREHIVNVRSAPFLTRMRQATLKATALAQSRYVP